MIAKGNPHNDGPYLARYLAAISKGDESAELEELRGFASDNIFEAFALGQLQASGTRCEKPFFHVQVRTPEGEDLSREQWRKVADRIEKHLGFQGQPRWSCFTGKTATSICTWSGHASATTCTRLIPAFTKESSRRFAASLRRKWACSRLETSAIPSEPGGAGRSEYDQARRLKTDIKAIRAGIRDCWERSDNGRSFVAALEAEGLVLARGDQRAFVVIDEKGGYHALSKRITGATPEETLFRLADLDTAKLPGVAAAKAMQLERQQRRKEDDELMPDEQVTRNEEQRQQAIREDDERRLKAIEGEEERKKEAIGEEEQRKQQATQQEEERKAEAIKEQQTKETAQREEKQRAEAKEQADRQAEQVAEMERLERLREAYKAQLARMAEEAKQQEEVRRQTEREGKALEGEIKNPHYRYGQALAQHYDVRNPYGLLARSAMAEYGAFLRDRERLDLEIARAKTPEARKALELRREIEFKEYMAITSDRIATQSEIIVGRRKTNEADPAARKRRRCSGRRRRNCGRNSPGFTSFPAGAASRAENRKRESSGKTGQGENGFQKFLGRRPGPMSGKGPVPCPHGAGKDSRQAARDAGAFRQLHSENARQRGSAGPQLHGSRIAEQPGSQEGPLPAAFRRRTAGQGS